MLTLAVKNVWHHDMKDFICKDYIVAKCCRQLGGWTAAVQKEGQTLLGLKWTYVSFSWSESVLREHETRSAFLQTPLFSRKAEKSNPNFCLLLRIGKLLILAVSSDALM